MNKWRSSEAHQRKIQLEGKAEANRCVLSCFLKIWIVEHHITERGREFQMVGPADLNPLNPADLNPRERVLTESMCTGRAEGTQRNMRMDEGRKI